MKYRDTGCFAVVYGREERDLERCDIYEIFTQSLFTTMNDIPSDTQTTFAEAYKRLEQIYQTCMSSEMLDVDKMVALQDEAKRCYELCHSMLVKTQEKLDVQGKIP